LLLDPLGECSQSRSRCFPFLDRSKFFAPLRVKIKYRVIRLFSERDPAVEILNPHRAGSREFGHCVAPITHTEQSIVCQANPLSRLDNRTDSIARALSAVTPVEAHPPQVV